MSGFFWVLAIITVFWLGRAAYLMRLSALQEKEEREEYEAAQAERAAKIRELKKELHDIGEKARKKWKESTPRWDEMEREYFQRQHRAKVFGPIRTRLTTIAMAKQRKVKP